MASEKSRALVIRVIDFSETSCVVTLFSEDFGKISALAKGARRLKSPFESALDLLSLCRIVFLRKSSDALHLLTEAKLERRFRAAARSLPRLYAGYYVAELLRSLTDEGDPHLELFQIANDFLFSLDNESEWRADLLRFELNALRLLGHMPMLDACVGCGECIENTKRVAFGQLAGGVLCGKCRIGQHQVVSVSGEVIATMRQYTEQQTSVQHTAPLTPRVAGEMRGVLSRYLCHLLGHRPRMHQWLDGQPHKRQ
ncbi:MAG: DNA repair protein RecO [Planctomycetaceae bacterium]|nr:DNA repair protein RecO [Planctomycetaceae bacterium]HAA70787.1 DNA repair protein RecO [Planctomycetaceae bacterium]|tara:strand:- start:4685 stop:5449 length:765 start_codon:yes stop_codon:yes gene_type:complete